MGCALKTRGKKIEEVSNKVDRSVSNPFVTRSKDFEARSWKCEEVYRQSR